MASMPVDHMEYHQPAVDHCSCPQLGNMPGLRHNGLIQLPVDSWGLAGLQMKEASQEQRYDLLPARVHWLWSAAVSETDCQ